MNGMTVEALTVVIWELVKHMEPEQVLKACEDLENRPVGQHVAPLLKVMREEMIR